jgi:hypothetical protein
MVPIPLEVVEAAAKRHTRRSDDRQLTVAVGRGGGFEQPPAIGDCD